MKSALKQNTTREKKHVRFSVEGREGDEDEEEEEEEENEIVKEEEEEEEDHDDNDKIEIKNKKKRKREESDRIAIEGEIEDEDRYSYDIEGKGRFKKKEKKRHEFTPAEIAIRRRLQGTRDMFLYDYGLAVQELSQNIKYRIALKREDEFGNIPIPSNDNNNNNMKRNFTEMSMSDTNADSAIFNGIDNNDNEKIVEPPRKRANRSVNNNKEEKMEDIEMEEQTTLILPTHVEENIAKSEGLLSKRMEKVMEDVITNPRSNRSISDGTAGNLPSSNINDGRGQLIKYDGQNNMQILSSSGTTKGGNMPLQLKTRKQYLQPEWHAPWKLYKVISGHHGWVGSIAVDPSNEWFCTGSADRTIKVWEFPTGVLKLTLTGHIAHVRGLAISARNPYLFSCGEDKKVCCWDLEQNKMIRSYHGHLSGVYCLALHPTIDVLFTGGRDTTCRVWDIRTKMAIQVLTGHKNTVHSIASQAHEPQLITGSHDHTVRCWDLKKFQTRTILTHHKKAIRSIIVHPLEYTFATGAADNIKVWKCPESSFIRNFNEVPGSIVEGLAINRSNVLASVHQTGHVKFWDWRTGHLFHSDCPPPQPGSLDSESGVGACAFDITGSRLISCGIDKTLKFYKEDTTQTPETFPIQYKPNLNKHF